MMPDEVELPCAKCNGQRTWPDHSYCRTCNNEYRRQRMQDPAKRARKRQQDVQSLRRRQGLPTEPRRRYWEGA